MNESAMAPAVRISLDMLSYNDDVIRAEFLQIEGLGVRVSLIPIPRVASPSEYLGFLRDWAIWLPALYVLKRMSDKFLDKLGEELASATMKALKRKPSVQTPQNQSSTADTSAGVADGHEVEMRSSLKLECHLSDGFRVEAAVGVTDSSNIVVDISTLVAALNALTEQEDVLSLFLNQNDGSFGRLVWDCEHSTWQTEPFEWTTARKYCVFDRDRRVWVEHSGLEKDIPAPE